jgi:transcriptional regulator with XRE-family HTH domain
MDRKEKALRELGRHVTALRQQKQLSIRELADAAGLEFRQIQQIEEGKVDLLFTTLLALAKGLEVTPTQLLQFR